MEIANFLLQTPSFGIFESLVQYGMPGVIILGLGAALFYLIKRQLSSEDNLRSRVDELHKELTTYVRDDQNQIREAIENNTDALKELKDFIVLQTIHRSNGNGLNGGSRKKAPQPAD